MKLHSWNQPFKTRVVGKNEYNCFFSFSSHESKAHWWAYRIGRPPPSVVRRLSICRSAVGPPSSLFKQKLLGQSKSDFIWSLHGIGERKFVQMVHVTWPKWPPCPYMGKNLQQNLLRNQKADDLETWYAASGARVLLSLFKNWPWIDLDLFYGMVNVGLLCSCMGKR